MKNYRIFYVVLLFALLSLSCAKSGAVSILYDDQLMKEAKKCVENETPAVLTTYNALKNYTDSIFLKMEPLSVVTAKTRLAPSRDPRDYVTLSPYWWPDSTKPDGLPYIRKDGQRNPEVYEYHERVNMSIMSQAVQSLAVMYYISGEEKYAQKCAAMLRAWFLSPETGMNPNMTYAQSVPGMVELRGTGIIEARRIAYALNAAKMIEGSASWSAEDKKEMMDWADAFRYWLEHSVNGQKEHNAPNNHGMWYECTHLAVVYYTGDYESVNKILDKELIPRIDKQMEKDGSLPEELARTLGLHYSTFAMEALSMSDVIVSKIGRNIWEYKEQDGKGMLLGVEFLKQYWQSPEKWPYMQIKPFEKERGALLLLSAGLRTGNKEYIDLAKSIGYDPQENDPENSDSQQMIYSLLFGCGTI
jgi:hypothetical protein